MQAIFTEQVIAARQKQQALRIERTYRELMAKVQKPVRDVPVFRPSAMVRL